MPVDPSVLINNAMTQANDAKDSADTIIAAANTAAMGYSNMPARVDITGPSITVQPFETSADFSNDYLTQYNALVTSMPPSFKTTLDDIIATYFPSFSSAVDEAEAWIANQITNGGMGLPVSVETALWNRGRDRILDDAARAEDEAVNAFAVMGFSLPNGVISNRLQTIQVNAQNKISEFNRDVSIEQAKIMVETTKFAVAEAMRMRTGVWGILMDYLSKYQHVNDLADAKGRGVVAAKGSLYNALGDYYRTLLNVEQLDVEIKKFNALEKKDYAKTDVNLFDTRIARQVSTAISSAGLYSQIAASYAASINAVAATSEAV